MSDTATNPFLEGNLAPVSEETTAFDLRVTGTLPSELSGRYLRNGPNPMAGTDPSTYHWFTGAGMVNGIRLDAGRASWYRSRWVRSHDVSAALGEPPPPSDWPKGHGSFAANTNVIGFGGKTFAIVEAGFPPIELNDELDTVRISNLGGSLPQSFSAHPKLDPLTGELHVMTYWWGWGNQIQYLVVGVDGRVRRTVDIPLPGGPMVHDMALTETYVLVFDLPCVFDLDYASTGASLPYRWNDTYEARIGLLPRDGGADDITWCSIDPCYIFHPLNAYDDGDTVVLDAIRHPRMFSHQLLGPDEGKPSLDRWVLKADGTSTHTVLAGEPQEFPRIDERLLGRRHRYGYTAGVGNTFKQDALRKIDCETGDVVRRGDSDRYGWGEPVFIPRTADAAEDDGWLMALRLDTDTNLSEFVVLDARGIDDDPVAVVHLPVRIPNGFHGNWVGDQS